jgi:hypothetical protein
VDALYAKTEEERYQRIGRAGTILELKQLVSAFRPKAEGELLSRHLELGDAIWRVGAVRSDQAGSTDLDHHVSK